MANGGKDVDGTMHTNVQTSTAEQLLWYWDQCLLQTSSKLTTVVIEPRLSLQFLSQNISYNCSASSPHLLKLVSPTSHPHGIVPSQRRFFMKFLRPKPFFWTLLLILLVIHYRKLRLNFLFSRLIARIYPSTLPAFNSTKRVHILWYN